MLGIFVAINSTNFNLEKQIDTNIVKVQTAIINGTSTPGDRQILSFRESRDLHKFPAHQKDSDSASHKNPYLLWLPQSFLERMKRQEENDFCQILSTKKKNKARCHG